MAQPRLLYGVGATKAGTSWLYRELHDHPDCALRAVKELHYWDTMDAEVRDKQIAALHRRVTEFEGRQADAIIAGKEWRVRNIARQLEALHGLIAMLGADRGDHAAYLGFLGDGADGRLTADITPAYGLLPEPALRQMLAAAPEARVVFLMRDPLARLWSHVRMQAARASNAMSTEERANNMLRRIVRHDKDRHVTQRGDYPAIVSRLRKAVPDGSLHIDFMERLVTEDGFARMCRFLGIAPRAPQGEKKEHVGPRAEMRDNLRKLALRSLAPHYEWAAREMGPLPEVWQQNMERALA